MTILGIETSCDETAAAVVSDGKLVSNIISSQTVHEQFGGIVPELASRAHMRSIIPIIHAAISGSGTELYDITHVAVTQGPGLIGALLVGINTAKAFAISRGIPCIPVNHIEAHMFSPFLGDEAPVLPYLCLVVSGGHTLLVKIDALDSYTLLGATIDDAAGEAFDKVAHMLGLPFPGGPQIDTRASLGAASTIAFPRSQLHSNDYCFSFSGLKTSVLYYLRKNHALDSQGSMQMTEAELNDVCASFQQAVIDVLSTKLDRAMTEYGIRDIAVVGGVSANRQLQQSVRTLAEKHGGRAFIPGLAFSTDNAAMIAMLAYLKLQRNAATDSYRFSAFARLPSSFFR